MGDYVKSTGQQPIRKLIRNFCWHHLKGISEDIHTTKSIGTTERT